MPTNNTQQSTTVKKSNSAWIEAAGGSLETSAAIAKNQSMDANKQHTTINHSKISNSAWIVAAGGLSEMLAAMAENQTADANKQHTTINHSTMSNCEWLEVDGASVEPKTVPSRPWQMSCHK